GSACGMPYAPDVGFVASTSHLLSPIHRSSRQANWSPLQPYSLSIDWAISRGSAASTSICAAAAWPPFEDDPAPSIVSCFSESKDGRAEPRVTSLSARAARYLVSGPCPNSDHA